MATIFDYLEWRGDVPLSADPFNEVDNLILSELIYADFRGIVPKYGNSVTLRQVCDDFFSRRTREEVRAEKWFTAKAPLLMDGMLSGARFRDTRLSYYVDEIDTKQQTQFAAVTFILPDDSTYIAFRGTDGSIVGWKEDFSFLFMPATEGQNRSINYLNRIARIIPGQLRIGGHSKGGNFAVYGSAFCNKNVRKRISEVYSNDGPGFRPEVVETDEYQSILPKIIKIIPDTSVIGLLMASQAQPRVIKSQAFGLIQHDGFSWLVKRNRFEESSLTMMSELIDKALVEWISQMDDDTRRTLIETVFSTLESTGAEGFREMTQQKWKSAGAILSKITSIPWKKQLELWQIMHRLGQASGNTIGSYISSLINKQLSGENRLTGGTATADTV
ncbi:DUF2974 domain-containing protein [bacterium]|nr:DUF2974 domain-containing protein [bacterium]